MKLVRCTAVQAPIASAAMLFVGAGSVPRIIFSDGREMGSSDKFNEVLTLLADKLGSALDARRAAVDACYAPNAWQMEQAGKIVVFDWVRPQSQPVVVVPGADHFFSGRLHALRSFVVNHLCA